jgi:hypothetical protein
MAYAHGQPGICIVSQWHKNGVLVSWGCHNKVLQAGGLNIRNLFSASSLLWQPEM